MKDGLKLKPGSRLRTGGATYEVTSAAEVPAGVVEVAPQATRLLKVFCKRCGYTCRITQRWIAKSGAPDCPACLLAMEVEKTKPVKSEPVAAPAAEPIADSYGPNTGDMGDLEAIELESAETIESELARLLAAEL